VLRKALVVGFDNKITLVWVALLARGPRQCGRVRLTARAASPEFTAIVKILLQNDLERSG